MSPAALPKVVVLGGGIAGLTTAYELSRSGWQERYSSIVVYQQGWRLGGKAASGRDLEREHRIEEHGLHIWFGYYENAFRMLAGCHEELDAMAAGGGDSECRRWSPAMTSIDRGFHPCNTIGLADDEPDGTWTQWLASFPESDTTPWDRDIASEPMAWDLSWYLDRIGERTVARSRTALRSLVKEVDLRPLTLEPEPEDRARLVDPILLVDEVLGRLEPVARRLVDTTVAAASGMRLLADRDPDDALVRLVLAQIDAADTVLDYLRVRYDEPIRQNATLRRLMTVLDLFLGVARGLLAHRIVTEDDLDALDEWEWDEWLATQGVRIESRESTLVRGLSYALPFAYFQGNRDDPIFSAGVGLRLFLRSFFTYRGALMWKPNAGMGDVVFAPLFELLVKRGVDVRFFHRVTDLDVDQHARRVTGVHLHRQRSGTTPPPGDSERLRWYRERFLVPVRPHEGAGMAEGELQCWPNRPLPDWGPGPADFSDGDLLGVPSDAGDPDYVPIDRDDVVVLALPLGVIAHVGTQLLGDARWKAQVEEVGLVATQSAQALARGSVLDEPGLARRRRGERVQRTLRHVRRHAGACRTEGSRMGAQTVVYLCGVLSDHATRPDGPTHEPAASDAGKSPDAVEREWLLGEHARAREAPAQVPHPAGRVPLAAGGGSVHRHLRPRRARRSGRARTARSLRASTPRTPCSTRSSVTRPHASIRRRRTSGPTCSRLIAMSSRCRVRPVTASRPGTAASATSFRPAIGRPACSTPGAWRRRPSRGCWRPKRSPASREPSSDARQEPAFAFGEDRGEDRGDDLYWSAT